MFEKFNIWNVFLGQSTGTPEIFGGKNTFLPVDSPWNQSSDRRIIWWALRWRHCCATSLRPTLTSLSQRRTLASMVSLSGGNPARPLLEKYPTVLSEASIDKGRFLGNPIPMDAARQWHAIRVGMNGLGTCFYRTPDFPAWIQPKSERGSCWAHPSRAACWRTFRTFSNKIEVPSHAVSTAINWEGIPHETNPFTNGRSRFLCWHITWILCKHNRLLCRILGCTTIFFWLGNQSILTLKSSSKSPQGMCQLPVLIGAFPMSQMAEV